MANPNIGQLLATTWNKVVTDSPEDTIFNDLWLFNQLTSGKAIKRTDGGAQIEITLEYAKNTTFRSYSDMETLDVTRVDFLDAAQYDWKEHGGTLVISEIEKFKNMGEGRKLDILSAKIDNALMSAKDSINTAAFGDGTGNGSKDIHGLLQLVPDDPTTGTVGTINRATFSFWRTKQITDAGASASTLRANMRTMYNNVSLGYSADHPTFIVTDQGTFEAYEGLLTANERFTDKADGDAGYKNETLKFKGAKISFDVACPGAFASGTGRMYFLNPKFLNLFVAKSLWLKLGEPIEPTNQAIQVRKVLSILNLVVRQSRRLGVITSIA